MYEEIKEMKDGRSEVRLMLAAHIGRQRDVEDHTTFF
jgi:hypothetical protein